MIKFSKLRMQLTLMHGIKVLIASFRKNLGFTNYEQ